MLVHHGSNLEIRVPNLDHSRAMLDFGKGFYTTTNFDQAKDFAVKVVKRRKSGIPTVSSYNFDENNLIDFEVKKFDGINEDWLDFVAAHRLGTYNGKEYDIIIGPVADDRVIDTVKLFISGSLPKDATLLALKVNDVYDQFVFTTQKTVESLVFEKSEVFDER